MRAAASLIIVLSTSVWAGQAWAATERNLSKEQVSATAPALVQDTLVRASDSDLVKAAKAGVERRRRGASVWVINQGSLGTGEGGRFSVSNEPIAELPAAPPPEPHTPEVAPHRPAVDRAALEAERKQLEGTLARAAEESDQQYADEVDEDLVERQMEKVPERLREIDNQLKKP
jgi:hypothetical protein